MDEKVVKGHEVQRFIDPEVFTLAPALFVQSAGPLLALDAAEFDGAYTPVTTILRKNVNQYLCTHVYERVCGRRGGC